MLQKGANGDYWIKDGVAHIACEYHKCIAKITVVGEGLRTLNGTNFGKVSNFSSHAEKCEGCQFAVGKHKSPLAAAFSMAAALAQQIHMPADKATSGSSTQPPPIMRASAPSKPSATGVSSRLSEPSAETEEGATGKKETSTKGSVEVVDVDDDKVSSGHTHRMTWALEFPFEQQVPPLPSACVSLPSGAAILST